MRVKLQLVMCSDEGQEETVTDVITLNKNSQRIEHLVITITQTPNILSTPLHHLLQHQNETLLFIVSPSARFVAPLHMAHAPPNPTPPDILATSGNLS